jgi:Pectate lyase superfamily protein
MAVITDVIRDKGRDSTGNGGQVFNVKAYGALGTGLANPTQDDTAAFQAAITAASQSMGTVDQTATSTRGSVVFVPYGFYRITSTLHLPSGVSIRGAGQRTTQLRLDIGSTSDGLVWDLGTEDPYHVGAFLEDIDIMAGGAGVRDMVVLDKWQGFAFNRVRLYAATRYNLRVQDCIDVSAFHLQSFEAGVSGLYMDALRWVCTTCRFVSCYFQGTLAGPCVDVAGLGLTFDGCVFESSGTVNEELGIGAQVRFGTATFLAPYFENNSKYELLAGTVHNPVTNNTDTSVTVINPVIRLGMIKRAGQPAESIRKVAVSGGLRFERGSVYVLGGDYTGIPRPIILTPTTGAVFINANTYPQTPVMDGGSNSLKSALGTVLYGDPVTGNVIQTGTAGYEIGGGTLITRHISVTPPAWGTGNVPHGGTATTVVSVPGAALGDTVVIGGRHHGGAYPAGVLFFGAAGTNQVEVTMLNMTGSTLFNMAPQLRVDVWKH